MTNWDEKELDVLDLDELLSEEEPAEPDELPDESESGSTADLPIDMVDLTGSLENAMKESAVQDNAPEKDFFSFGREEPLERSSAGKRGRKNAAEDLGEESPRRRQTGHSDTQEEEEPPSRRRRLPIPLILAILIVVLSAVAIIRLIVWNQGVSVEIDTESNANRFNIEVNDSMVILSESDLEGAADDGVTTVLCLGNEPFSQDTSSQGLAGQIAELGGVEVINAAFPGSQVTCENAVYSTESLDDMDDIFNLFYVSYAISIDDFSSLETVASVHEDDTFAESVEALKNTDFSAVDIIAIMYDGIDYIEGMSMQNPDVPEELTTYVGSLYNSFVLLREAYPHIRIVFLSPYYAEYDGTSSRTTDLGNGTIVDYFQWAYDTCGSEGISFIDNYYGSINETNFGEYLTDGTTLNSAGCTKIADHFVYKVIEGNYAEYNPEEMLSGST